ncbi:MAG TPA: alkaline phosphatase family protein [Gemmatimonadaceae bacterium]|nr:alkaline phosphatase family protein [Gemmatimonadaceae bacterium]
MTTIPYVRRVIVVVLDGLRPDAIDAFGLAETRRLCERGAFTLRGETVAPSVTACAMTSLVTGVAPARHGVLSDAFHLPVPRGPIHPVSRVLARHGLPVTIVGAELPRAFRGLAHRAARLFGVHETHFAGQSCAEIALRTREVSERQGRGMVLVHLPDADRSGHADGWMSAPYGDAARRLDDALGVIVRSTIDVCPNTILIALADHGGGGADPFNHDSAHPADRTIPVMLAGRGIRMGPLLGPVSLLDVPATVLWSLGIGAPTSYTGKPLIEAFARARVAA